MLAVGFAVLLLGYSAVYVGVSRLGGDNRQISWIFRGKWTS